MDFVAHQRWLYAVANNALICVAAINFITQTGTSLLIVYVRVISNDLKVNADSGYIGYQ
jgi:hypothetical protein